MLRLTVLWLSPDTVIVLRLTVLWLSPETVAVLRFTVLCSSPETVAVLRLTVLWLSLTVLQLFAQADKMRDLRKRPAAPATPPQGDDASGQNLAQQVAAGLRELADKVEAQPELISKAADLMSLDFMDSRAPPSEVRTADMHILWWDLS